MASSITKAKIPVAAPKLSKFDLPSMHITTQGFMRFHPCYYRNVVKNTKLKDHHDTFVRTAPLDKPFYGRVQMNNRAFFVPYRTIWEPWEDFRNDVPHTTNNGTELIQRVPRFKASDLLHAFTGFVSYGAFSSEVQNPNSERDYDFSFNDNTYLLTERGRVAYSLVESLGYKFFDSKFANPDFSALNLLAAAKIYMDWYYPSAYAHYGLSAWFNGLTQRQHSYTLNGEEIYNLLNLMLFVAYSSDFFTSLFDSPVGVNSDVTQSTIVIPDYASMWHIGSSLENGVNDAANVNSNNGASSSTPGIEGLGSSLGVSQFAFSSLKALTSYIARHRLSGSRALDRALSEFGVLLSAEKLKRCYYLGSDTFDLHVADVMSTAETDEASLGSYGGKAIASSSFDVDCDSDEDGVFMIINSIVPEVFYYQGVDKNVLNTFMLDFPTPEFDGLGPSPVVRAELLTSTLQTIDGGQKFMTDSFDRIFGFAPRYYEAKIPYNKVTGLFSINSTNQDLKSWFIGRTLSPDPNDMGSFVHNLDFVLGYDARIYNNVFLLPTGTDVANDAFYIVHRDNVSMMAPLKPLYDTYEFDGEQRNKVITTEPNGVKFN